MALHTPGNDLTGLSLCAGVGGLELGLHIAEPTYRTVCYVEREAFPAATLVARMEDKTLDKAPLWDDVTTFDGRAWRNKVHVLTAGYPCQPFSLAGKRKGEDDPRHLWPHVRRIIKEIDPEWCFFENVEGHMSLGADSVFRDLQGLGFTVKAGLFSALECGASQIRRRLFIMAHADKVALLQQNRDGTGERLLPDARRSEPDWQSISFGEGSPTLDTHMAADESLRSSADKALQLPLFAPPPSHFERWAEILDQRPDLQPEFFGLDHGVADRMDRSDAAGNGVVSLAAAYAWRTLKNAHLKGL
ncbi:DNA cytosine methyltransferase [Rhizobium rhizogenes]|uniref:DNA (cytosine-5-)-methyltransferase n=1 Tax=Rhizobium rhizogenes TaxID=359 RepID=A0AA92HA96_RHIRH|nr:DNA cytosine methyltransferase [Rhizobium rhizogenes]PVE56284.1 DNA cytosine methyltransferase [Rhizobium rhizogenes]PVE64779.1 DNA cytosine methyltransferase [Agrobacterium tumefaciens]PVE73917.1 DNA cytosine methyltransferase [Sphingomonas sp. TPD3009]